MTTVPESPPKVSLALKLLARAMDPACRDGEAETSATLFLHCCRREGITLRHLAEALAEEAQLDLPDPEPPEPAACEIVMPFGKYVGMTLADIAEECPGYICWGSRNLRTQPELRRACAIVAEWYGIAEEQP